MFGELDRLAPLDAIMATNSSSYPSSEVIDEVEHRERVLNMHFLTPPGSRACELMSCGHTEAVAFERLKATLSRHGPAPFRAHAESRSLIHNRI
jgi:3-hydroxybutyryl-CoA dehydrogenase